MTGRFVRDRLPDWPTFADREAIVLVGRGRWRTTGCVFHGGGDSMRVNTESGGWCCMSCGVSGGDVLAYYQQANGLDFMSAARALGAVDEAGEPSRPERPRTLPTRDALQLLAADALLVAVAAGNMGQGDVLTDQDRRALLAAAQRILMIAEEAV